MKKNSFLFAASVMLAMLFIACSGNSKKSETESATTKDSVSTETISKDRYMSKDLCTFDLRGPVKAVKYTGDEYTMPVIVEFYEDEGTFKSIYKLYAKDDVRLGKIDCDDKGRITSIIFEPDLPWMSKFDYDKTSALPKSYITTNESGDFTRTTYHRDAHDNIVKVDVERAMNYKISKNEDETVIKLSDYDDHGNWLLCTMTVGEDSDFYKREIVYAGEENIFDKDIENGLQCNPVIRKFIVDMYENQRYMDYNFLRKHCTPELLRHLKEKYVYDGDGYAVWLFRTDAQDGKPGSHGKDKVTKVRKDIEGWYHYEFTDGGWRGENKIKVSISDGKVMMSQVERVYDETNRPGA